MVFGGMIFLFVTCWQINIPVVQSCEIYATGKECRYVLCQSYFLPGLSGGLSAGPAHVLPALQEQLVWKAAAPVFEVNLQAYSLSPYSSLPVLLFLKKCKLGLYNRWKILYIGGEQSRKPCVKCCQNGELCGRRRTVFQSAIGFPHPLRHMGGSSFM